MNSKFQTYIRDCAKIFRLGLPVLVSQVGMIVVGFADNIMVGHYSTDALASASFVNNLFNLPIMAAMGFSFGLTPLVGALFTNGDPRRIGRLVKAGVWVNLFVALILMGLMSAIYFNLDRLGQPEHLLPLIRPYFLIVLSGMLPLCMFNTFAQWSYGVRNTSMPMWIMLAANLLNIVGNYALIFGHFGCPEMGLTGAGISTLTARVVSMLVIAGVFFLHKDYGEYAAGFRRERVTTEGIMNVVKMSWPISLQMSFETAAFSGCAILCGWIGAIEMAAFQIIVVVGTLGFCFYYAMGTAVSVLVANDAGRNNVEGMNEKAMAGYGVILAISCVSMLIFGFGARQLMHLFTEDAAVLTAAVGVIFPLLLYQVADATQINFANALRGTGNVRPMMWIALVSYIVVGLPASWLLAFPLGLGLYGIVLSFSCSLFLAAFLFFIYFRHTLRKFRERNAG